MGLGSFLAGAFRLRSGGNSFEAASRDKRLRNWTPSRDHVNAALQAAGPTLVARARWLYENDGYVGNAVDEWVASAIGEGIKPRPKFKSKEKKRELLDLFARWTDEADAEGLTDYFGVMEKVAREAYLAGECFVRMRARLPGDMTSIPLQLQILPTEMLDISFDRDLGGGRYIRAGIEFNAIGRRVAYHFFRSNPNDYVPGQIQSQERVAVPAADVLHVYDARQAGQIRGVPRVARVLVKAFSLEVYDDAELERKKTTALFTGFLIGRGDNVLVNEDNTEEEDDHGAPIAGMSAGAIVDLGDDKDIKFAQPAEVGGSYEPFQYRTLLKVCAGLGVPYSIVTGDVTRGNFSNARTSVIQFRRRVGQWQNNTMIYQFCRPVWARLVEVAVLSGQIDLPGYAENPDQYRIANHLPPIAEWIDPEKDVNATIKAIDAGLKSRTQAIAERGYDREELDDEIEEEQKDAKNRGLAFKSASGAPEASNTNKIGHNGGPPLEPEDETATPQQENAGNVEE